VLRHCLASRQVIRPPGRNFNPSWSPDGRQIAFASDRSGNFEIYRMKASPEGPTNRPVKLTRNPTPFDQEPTWSPNGRKIAFFTTRDGNNEIYSMRAPDGTNPTNLPTTPSSTSTRSGSRSPNGPAAADTV
jgi:Tol biopolymer transport system component